MDRLPYRRRYETSRAGGWRHWSPTRGEQGPITSFPVPVLGWIVFAGLAKSALALVGSAALLLPERLFAQVVMPLVALAAGALLGGAVFHMLPESVTLSDTHLSAYMVRRSLHRGSATTRRQ